MLEIFDQNPGSRVFHVDRECYVIYLGSHWEDFKPFLRIGTSPDLPASLPPIVKTIVVPDAVTGNPLDEPACLAGDVSKDTHYIGDVNAVEHMKALLQQDTIPVEAPADADHEEDDNKHVYVYFYRDGNLKLKFRKDEVLDLRRRERQDLHFIARAQQAKNTYGKSPFKLPKDIYQAPGFVSLKGSTYLIGRGELCALSLADNYFFDLVAAGLDADRIGTARVEDTDAALIRFFKRSRAKAKTLRIATPHPDRVDAAAALFPETSLPKLTVHTLDGHGGAFSFGKFSITQSSGRYEASHDALPLPLVIGSGSRGGDGVSIDPAKRTVTLAGDAKLSLPLLEGCVYQFPSESLSRTLIEDRFLPEKNYPYRDMLSQDENNLLAQVEYFFHELFGGRDTGKVLRTIRGLATVRDLTRGETDSVDPVVQVIMHNVVQFTGFLQENNTDLAKAAGSLGSALSGFALKPEVIPAELPLVTEVFITDSAAYGFVRFAARITGDRLAHANRVTQDIMAVPSIDFDAERNRLEDLIAGLATPEQMDEARLRRIAETKKKQTPPKSADAATEAADDATDAESTDQRDRRKKRKRSGWFVPVIILLVAVLVLLALMATGVIGDPWFGDRSATGQDNQDTTQTTADDPTTDGSSTDRTTDGTTSDGSTTGTDGSSTDDPTSDGTSADGTTSDGTTSDGTSADGTTSDGQPDDADTPVIPETGGWTEQDLPILRELQNTPGVTITRDRVIGPGGIEITLMDIIILVNSIATENGYAKMGEIASELPNPDWIYPGNVFVLPNVTRYTVVEGDTLWGIAVRYMIARLQKDYAEFVTIADEYEQDDTSDSRKRAIVSRLDQLAEETHTRNFSRVVRERLSSWGE